MSTFIINGKEISKKDIFTSHKKFNLSHNNEYEFIDIRPLGKDYTIEIQNVENYLKTFFNKNSYIIDNYFHLSLKKGIFQNYDPYLILSFKNKKDLLKFKLGYGT